MTVWLIDSCKLSSYRHKIKLTWTHSSQEIDCINDKTCTGAGEKRHKKEKRENIEMQIVDFKTVFETFLLLQVAKTPVKLNFLCNERRKNPQIRKLFHASFNFFIAKQMLKFCNEKILQFQLTLAQEKLLSPFVFVVASMISLWLWPSLSFRVLLLITNLSR